MQELRTHWTQAWSRLALPPPAGLYEQLLHAYGEPQRHYHTLQHLGECLAHLDSAADLAQHPGEVAIALWFHDAIYDVRGSSNEQQSADWAQRALHAAGAAPAVQARVHALILATCHDAVPVDPDQQLLVDIDLAILGAPAARFAQYEQQIRQEYAWVPRLLYNRKRRSVLQAFLARARIYSTSAFGIRFEAQARANLAEAVRALAFW
jgi:predicted metal-dependent HD superfamily phosphohydrolase